VGISLLIFDSTVWIFSKPPFFVPLHFRGGFVRKLILAGLSLSIFSLYAFAQEHDHASHSMLEMVSKSVSIQDEGKYPPPDSLAKARLEKSPRHGEYVDVKLESSTTPIRTWVSYPERKDKAPVVIIIHEIFGLSDWIRSVADQLAADGYIAPAPDLISGMGPGGGGTESVASRDDVTKLIQGLSADEAIKRLNTVRAYAVKLPAANGKSATVGYCWGGSQSYSYASKQPELNAAIVFYGTSPTTADLANIKAPVLGFYGGDDARVNATIEPASGEMKKLGKVYEYEIFEGAGHGFLRHQAGRNGANLRATQKAWPRMLEFLKKNL
jgi:carboxymethylenebutenolidase